MAAVVVDYDATEALAGCVASLLAEGVGQVVVVENGAPEGARVALAEAAPGGGVPVVVPGRNVGYGAGANRGVAAVAAGGGCVPA